VSADDRWRLSAFGDEIAVDLEDQIAVLHAHQVNHLELRAAWGINVIDLGQQGLKRARRILEAAGIGVSAVGSPVGKAPIEGDFNAEISRFERALEAAELLETPLVRVFSFFIPDGRYELHRDTVLHRMSVLTGLAAQRGLTLVHENECYIYGDTAERCRDLMEGVASPALRMAFDPANFVQAGTSPLADGWRLLAPYVIHFHVKDAVPVDRTGLEAYPAQAPGDRQMDSVRLAGQGEGDLVGLLRKLDDNAYSGFLTLEPHLAHRMPELDGAARFAAAVSALRNLLEVSRVAKQNTTRS
jgi:sugar phosphate isomerase/epimerase